LRLENPLGGILDHSSVQHLSRSLISFICSYGLHRKSELTFTFYSYVSPCTLTGPYTPHTLTLQHTYIHTFNPSFAHTHTVLSHTYIYTDCTHNHSHTIIIYTAATLFIIYPDAESPYYTFLPLPIQYSCTL
jgi:hypothetical protein